MDIPPLGGTVRSTRLEPLAREPGSRIPEPGSIENPESAEVAISAAAQRLRVHSVVLGSTLHGVESELFSMSLRGFDETSPSDAEPSIAASLDLSPEATAERILDGIRGYIYQGFLARNPEATQQDFESFKQDVMRGFKRGMGEAKSIIGASGPMDPGLAADIDRTETLAHEGLQQFFNDEQERFDSH